MCAFVVLGLVFPLPSQEIGLRILAWEHLQNDLFCVEWGMKPQLNQSVDEWQDIWYCCEGNKLH